MNFKNIELLGFKSFADKLEIKFGPGVTCIVGPNGCGKSNVADAIRWVLGEQSAKSLRGGNMQDVIFSGTQLRKSLSYCEVSLAFDNTEKMFDLDYTEVVFTRKLYRSGESEYLINRQPCRLKDIIGHLRSVGLGKDGYSIIGQNRIAEIMNSKPPERRSIFEEATGISGFKAKKAETERRLAAASENLARYTDIMNEVSRQLAPLAKQAESARKYFSLAESLKSHEINTYLYKYETAESSRKKITERIAELDAESEDKKSELAKAQKDYESAFVNQQNMDNVLYEMQEKLRERAVYVEKQQGEGKIYNERISSLKSEVVRNTDYIKNGEERLKQIEKERLSLENQIKETNEKLKKLSEDSTQASRELDEINELIRSFEEATELNRDRMINSIESLAQIRQNAGSLSAEKQTLKERKEELFEKRSETTQKQQETSKKLTELSENAKEKEKNASELKEIITQKNILLKETNISLGECENNIYSENAAFSTHEANHRMLSALKESFGGYNYAVKNLMNAAKGDASVSARIKGVIADIVKTTQVYETAIETAIGGAMQNIVTDSADDARHLIEFLKRTRGGTVTFLPVRSVKPRFDNPNIRQASSEPGAKGLAAALVKYDSYYESVVKYLLGNTLICDNIANAVTIAKKYSYSFKIVTLEGDIINPSGSVTGGYKKAESVNLLANERKLEETAEKLEKSRINLNRLKEEKIVLSSKKQALSSEIEELSGKYNSVMQASAELGARREAAETKNAELLKELEDLNRTIDAIGIRIERIEAEESEATEGKKRAEEQKDLESSKMQEGKAEHEGLKEKQKRLNAVYSQLRVEINTAELNKNAFAAEIERLQNEKSQSEMLLENFERENKAKEQTIELLKKEAEKSALSQSELTELNEIRERVESLNESKKEISKSLTELDVKKTELTQEITKLSEKKYNQELALTRLDSELDSMRERIWEEYQATYENSVSLKIEGYDVSAGKAEITRLKREITSLGSINYNAIEDYNEQSARFEEMQTQKSDLEKAHEDLSKVLKELKTEMQKQFDEGFTKINESFKRTFKELFGGGRAQLQMDYTDCEDPLEAGVEIVAEPPGKKLQKISLLSGGEQALTAIAILFAILSLRAMPFCVLDEIEAALDEANVERFAKYLKNFSEKTQFIVITHRKPTMELADALFGVTMEEKGVSRMVSVKMSDIENQLDIA